MDKYEQKAFVAGQRARTVYNATGNKAHNPYGPSNPNTARRRRYNAWQQGWG